MLQQPLPFTVLKRSFCLATSTNAIGVATALTVYGIETYLGLLIEKHSQLFSTVLTVYGIETQ